MNSSNLWTQATTDIENEKAVLMGNRESVMFIYILNCVVCVLFFIQGVLMWRAAKPTLEMIGFLQEGNVNDVPADLKRHTQVESFI